MTTGGGGEGRGGAHRATLWPVVPVALFALLSAAAARAGEPPGPALLSPRRYGDPVTVPPRSALAARVEALALRLAATRHGAWGEPLEVSPSLEMALDLLAPVLPAAGPPPVASTEQALSLAGIVEPVPYLLTMIVPDGADDDALRQTERLLPPMLARGRYRRLAVATAPLRPGAVRLVLALQESFIQIAPVERAVRPGGTVVLAFTVLAPYHAPSLFVTDPAGAVSRLAPEEAASGQAAFRAEWRCGPRAGLYQIEITAEDRFGEAVLANFPVRCGLPAPSGPGAIGSPPDKPAPAVAGTMRVADVEARVFDLLAADRARAGLPPLTLDARLSAIARAHSEEMRDRPFFGHISPTSGSALDRLRRAGFAALRVRENLGRAASPDELERGLMNSPSHRANVLAGDVQHVGVGVAVGGTGGAPELYLTQLFAQLPAEFDPGRARRVLRLRLEAIRRDARLPALVADPALDAVAERVARALAEGSISAGPRGSSGRSSPADPLDQALPALAGRFNWVRKVTALALDASQLSSTTALVDRQATHAGVAAVRFERPPGGGAGDVCLVVLLAAKR